MKKLLTLSLIILGTFFFNLKSAEFDPLTFDFDSKTFFDEKEDQAIITDSWEKITPQIIKTNIAQTATQSKISAMITTKKISRDNGNSTESEEPRSSLKAGYFEFKRPKTLTLIEPHLIQIPTINDNYLTTPLMNLYFTCVVCQKGLIYYTRKQDLRAHYKREHTNLDGETLTKIAVSTPLYLIRK